MKIVALTKNQQDTFVEFYHWLYGDTSKETGTGKLPVITSGEEEWHTILWTEQIRRMLPKRTSQKEIDRVFSHLRFQFGPEIKGKNF